MKNMSEGQQFKIVSGLRAFMPMAYLALALLSGCSVIEVPAPKQFDCGDWNEDHTSWYCRSRATGKCIRNEYIEAEACNSIERTD